MSPAPHWTGRLFVRQGRLLYAGPVGPTDRHAHHAFQVVVGASGPVGLADDAGVEAVSRAAVVPPDAAHAVTRLAASAVMLYVDPDDHAGRRLRRAVESAGQSSESWVEAARPLAALPIAIPEAWASMLALEATLLDTLAGPSVRPRPVHPAVTRALRAVAANLDGDVSLEATATRAGLSAGRLSHLFAEEVGIPLRPYILWMRLMRAAEHVQRGESLTAAAHAGGFADSAHMNHAFRKMFGLTPSDVSRAVEWVLPPEESPA